MTDLDLDVNEPLFVIRGSDPIAVAAIHAYAEAALREGDNEKAKRALAAETEVQEWQLSAEHKTDAD